MYLLDDNYTNEQISLQIVLNNINDFNKSYKKLVSKKGKSWSSLINYHLIITKIFILLKTNKPDISLTQHLWYRICAEMLGR